MTTAEGQAAERAARETFRFNGNLKDIEQVAKYLPAFEAVLAELEAAGQYRYNDAFKGRIPAIANTAQRGPNVGTHEETAIYLLQKLERARRLAEKVAALEAEGYVHVEYVDGVTRYRRVIFYSDPYQSFRGEWQEWADARLLPEERPMRDGEFGNFIHGVLPKGKRTHGVTRDGRKVLVLA